MLTRDVFDVIRVVARHALRAVRQPCYACSNGISQEEGHGALSDRLIAVVLRYILYK